ncbi:hypothetical protein AMTRI_Chr08g164700 [Amborella trichopoda]
MRDIKPYLSVALVLTTLWFGTLACLLIEINYFFPDVLAFPFFLLIIRVERNSVCMKKLFPSCFRKEKERKNESGLNLD